MGFFAALFISGAMVEIQSPSGCPSAAEVGARVAALVENKGAAFAPDRAEIRVDGANLEIELTGRGGSPTISRELAVSGSCTERASAAATLIARWETELHPDVALRRARPPESPPPVPRTVTIWDIGGGLVTFLAGGAAFGATLEGAVARDERGFGARLALTLASSRDEPIGMGAASWRRFLLSAGARYRFVRGPYCADATADFVGGFLSVGGSGFAGNMDESDFDPGIQAGARVGRAWGSLEPWLSASVLGWLREERLHVTGLATVTSLPRAEVLLGAGVSWRFAP